MFDDNMTESEKHFSPLSSEDIFFLFQGVTFWLAWFGFKGSYSKKLDHVSKMGKKIGPG